MLLALRRRGCSSGENKRERFGQKLSEDSDELLTRTDLHYQIHSMAQKNENTEQSCAAVTLCSGGCGFFGSTQFDGMCSKCYKDALKRKQATNAPQESTERSSIRAISSYLNSIETASPTVSVAKSTEPSTSTAEASRDEGAVASSVEAEEKAGSCTDSRPSTPSSETKTKKRNRCTSCKKKVGLTGFECRCGGLYCSTHRYSDKHDCQFDYKKEGEDLIRKNNPVVVGAKLQKI